MTNGKFHVTAQIRKSDEDADSVRIYGWAAMSIDDIGEPVIDSDGDYLPVHELEKAAQDAFVRRGGAGAVGVQHTEMGKADIVESMVMTADKRAAFEFGDGPQGWAVGLSSAEPDVIKAVRSGSLLELSLRGRGRVERVRVPDGQSLSDIVKGATSAGAIKEVRVIRDLQLADAELLSIVDKGASANDRVRSRVVLIKRAVPYGEETTMPETTKARPAAMILADLFEAGKFSDLPPEDKETLLAMAGQMPKPSDPIPEEKPKAEDEAKSEGEDEEMSKRHTELAKENAGLRGEIADLRKRMERNDVVELVKSEMLYVPTASVDDLVGIIQESRANLAKRDSDKIETLLKAVSKACETSKAFEKSGSRAEGGAESNDASAELMTLAKSLREKDSSLSRSDSILAAGRQRPDLWERRNG